MHKKEMSASSTQPSPDLTPLMSPLTLTPSNNKIKATSGEGSLSLENTTPSMTSPLQTPGKDTSFQISTTSTKKSKLSAILGDGSFESIMKERATKRREKDDQCIAELRYSISNMDLNLTQEIKRRIESIEKLENDCQKNIENMEQKLYSVMDEKVRSIEFRLNNLEEKVQELNERLEEEKYKIPRDIEAKGRELKEMINEFQEEFNSERRDRIAREGRIMKQLTAHAEDMTTTWQQESQKREECVQELRSRLDEHEHYRAQADQSFETLIARELEALRMDVEKERMERMAEDDEIVDALNRYTEKLQNSLSTLSLTGV